MGVEFGLDLERAFLFDVEDGGFGVGRGGDDVFADMAAVFDLIDDTADTVMVWIELVDRPLIDGEL